MTREETRALLTKIKIHYHSSWKDLSRPYMEIMLNDWYTHLKQFDAEVVSLALDKYIHVNQYAPKISDIVNYASAIRNDQKRINSQKQLDHNKECIPMPDDVREKLKGWLI